MATKSKCTAAKLPEMAASRHELFMLMSQLISLREKVAQAELQSLYSNRDPEPKSRTASPVSKPRRRSRMQ
jgi:hypothetical protein